NLHFGNSPPPEAQGVEAKDRAKSQAELDCEAAARRQCDRDINTLENYFDLSTETIRYCMEEYTKNCARLSNPTSGPAQLRNIVTPRIHYSSATGDTLVCKMSCPKTCTGDLDISDQASLGRGRNDGASEYTLKIEPKGDGSAVCTVRTLDPGVTV